MSHKSLMLTLDPTMIPVSSVNGIKIGTIKLGIFVVFLIDSLFESHSVVIMCVSS